MKRIFLALLLVLCLPLNASASVLSDLAASMAPGQWTQVTGMIGLTSSLFTHPCSAASNNLTYADGMAWDSVKKKVHHVGSPHCGTSDNVMVHVQYDDATNTWSKCIDGDPNCIASGFGINNSTHSFNYNAIDSVRGHFYRRFDASGDGTWKRWDLTTFVATQLADEGGISNTLYGGGAFFPEYDSGNGGYVYYAGQTNIVKVHKRASDTWDTYATVPPTGSNYHNFARHSAVHQVVFMGGGNTDKFFYTLSAAGVLTRRADSPVALGTTHSLTWADPVTGDLLALGMEGAAKFFYKYTLANNTWTALTYPSAIDPNGISQGGVQNSGVVEITNYGVALFVFFVDTNTTKAFLYKHADTFQTRCAAAGVIGCWGFDSATNLRSFPVAADFPIRYFWNASDAPNCNSAGLGTNHTFTNNRNAGEGNALAQRDGLGNCWFPSIDTSVFSSGAGALKITIPGQGGSGAGGYFDMTFTGHDNSTVAIGPHNGSEIYHQFKYRSANNAVNDFGGYSSLQKIIIFGAAPPTQLGTDFELLSVMGYSIPRNDIYQSYSYTPGGNSDTDSHERFIGPTLYVQTGTLCPYPTFDIPPCIPHVDNQWQEITRHFKLNPVASDFSVSGNTLTRTNTFTNGVNVPGTNYPLVGRYVYIVGDGYYQITGTINADSVTLGGSPAAGSSKSVYISVWKNSTIKQWINGVLITDLTDAIFTWDFLPNGNVGFAQFRLQPHMTGKSEAVAHSNATVWYDDFIISTQPIAMGTVAGAGPTPVIIKLSQQLKFSVPLNLGATQQ